MSARRLSAEELAERHRELPRVDPALIRQEADDLFGDDHLTDDDPWTLLAERPEYFCARRNIDSRCETPQRIHRQSPDLVAEGQGLLPV